MEIYKRSFEKVFAKKDVFAIRGMFDEAYMLTNQLYARETFLNSTDIGLIDIRPDILRAAIAKVAQTFSNKGVWGWSFGLAFNTAKNCRHVELSNDENTLYITRISDRKSIPAKALYRKSVEMNLFSTEENDKENVKVFLATYGDNGQPEFVTGSIGIHGIDAWLYKVPLLPGIYKVISSKQEEELLVELYEDIKEGEGQNGKGATE